VRNDWKNPPPGFCEVNMVAHGGTSVTGSFIQTLTMVDVATGWTECRPLVTRDGSLVVEAMKDVQSLFPWLLRGVDFDNDSAFMNDTVVNGAVVRRLMGYGRFEGVETARVMTRLYAAARLYVNFFQPIEAGDPRATHRRPRRPYKTRVRMPSKLDPHVATIEGWLAAEPRLTAMTIVGRLSEKHPSSSGRNNIRLCSVC
jgi:hypothetical protein